MGKFEFDTKSLKEIEDIVGKLNLSDNTKYKVTSTVAEQSLPMIQEETPEDSGNLKESFVVKRGSKNKGVSVISNDATNEKDGERYGWILNYKEGQHQGWFDRAIDMNEDEIENMLLRELEKELGI